MIHVEGKVFLRGGEKIGWVADNDFYDKSGRKLGYFQGNDIFDADGKKIAWMASSHAHTVDGGRFSFEENRNVITGGLLSNEERAAARILFGE